MQDMEKWESRLGAEFLKKIGIKKGDKVLDFGCRVGHYTIPASKAVGRNGVVYAIEKEDEALEELKQKIIDHNLKNIKITKTNGQLNLPFPKVFFDVVLLYDVMHYFDANDRLKVYSEVFRILKDEGFLSVYPKHTSEHNPSKEFSELKLRDVKEEIQNSGFDSEKKHCGLISHDDHLTDDCVYNYRKIIK